MGEQVDKKPKKRICVGLLAHVDAGKTTLSESLLYLSGSIRRLGRVDNQDAFLDTHELERARGITIFSKQAVFPLGDKSVALLDTPGHVDFSAEMERTLQVLDYAILIISGADGVQGHTRTLWKLLKRYGIPVFLFVNKMDQNGTDREALLEELRNKLDDRCVDFGGDSTSEEFLENIAMSEEGVLEHYLAHGEVPGKEIVRLIAERKVFPCYFGSALKLTGVEEFLAGLEEYTECPQYGEAFGAKVFKINRDEQGSRLTYLKVTGGCLRVKDLLTGGEGEAHWEEKVNQIRIYSGAKYEAVSEAEAGSICAVTGLGNTRPGEGLGAEAASDVPLLEPVLTYQIRLPRGCDPMQMLGKLRLLEEEEPELHIRWDEQLQEIQAQLMGEVQIEVLKILIRERFGVSVDFGAGSIVYKETIAGPVEGVGHFEPLRHYAEVHLLLEPGEPGSGMQFAAACSEDVLDRNWQRLILTHLEEKVHKGVLTGSEITDMRITLASGKAHLKHTEGGDFRQATYRAVRQGLMKAENVLLEPYYEFRLEVPSETVGRVMADVEKMCGSFEQPQLEEEMSILTGTVPVATMRNYQQEVNSYTKGRGRLFCTLKGYALCHNAEEVLEQSLYDPEADMDNPPDSVFCYHGAGTVVPWYEVSAHMHLESILSEKQTEEVTEPEPVNRRRERPAVGTIQEEKELEEIFARTFGAPKSRVGNDSFIGKVFGESRDTKAHTYKPRERLKEYLLVDGYNIIFAWEDLNELAKTNIDGARGRLMDVMCNYQGFRKCELILVFDAYRVEGHTEETVKYHNIHVVYTKEAETADQYIERTAHEIGRKYQVTVATSDGLEQIIIRGQGCAMMSARELQEEVERINRELRETYMDQFPGSRNYLFDYLPEELAEHLNEVRLGKRTLDEET
ncbi:MAG: TetM/TetW/TetO/TetS family tetracycline resistance ribosomal protection protein [Clostridiales bacterium]|nr:TetM/TetW/TetO/TetS family tetracycline resistance ribosomal protection protein [Clostridiales bacterium]